MAPSTKEISVFIREAAPHLDGELRDYVLGYFDDPSSDRSQEGLQDFLEPLLSEAGSSKDEIDALCEKLAALTPSTKQSLAHGGVVALDGPVVMNQTVSTTLEFTRANIGDIRHGHSTNGPKSSTVDQRKLRAAEKKLAEKKAARDKERTALLAEEKQLNSALSKSTTTPEAAETMTKRLKEVYQRLEEIDADTAESKASSILNGLGFSPEQQRAATKTFSGGWRMRLALARALFCKPDLLLADEVTNYLDFPAVVWLERYFQKWQATLLIVSHDRSFLDAVSTDILHLHDGLLDYYRGNFSTFVGTKAERRKNQLREYEAQLQYRQHLQAFIDRWRYNAKRAAQAQSKIKILEKLPPLEPPPKDDMEGISGEGQDIYFRFPDPEKLSPPILRMEEVTFGYNEQRTILSGVSFDLQMDSKIAVVGPNGAGKSTLIRLMTGQVEPQKGMVSRHGRLRIALFSQHHVDQLELGASSVQFLQSKFPGMQEEDYRRVLGRFGLTGTTALQPIGTLSGGQKSRAVFAWMAMTNPHVLVLDEPTNHLDMDSIDALASALREFKGGIAIVSHDERFLDAVCNEVWVCDQGKLTRFEGKVGDGAGVVNQYKKSLKIEEV
ncbi:uncharacterized protein SPPG_07820 [Spizellomyces punctatus DAOM BR117]|uniref:ABC transporter domain-containing protein n=1 Tax=Spizellomyces punctatus (strain DAOM BR117) TaxID=645134 RepID=A0A0L0H7R2_SPIPD|nr:uncharacterized protein SPPG_07820 [Spizellomyces punctatus DAOM BR117]KNC97004.1 hypothetical protein SPPG_07820 [Spizellomyces punctatus DAOM BR117]|eukprot:XP_016605044.1 hypothetical protein SPPG_07820 [Spizellomyces punctatus DAOM BR117]